MARTTVPLKPLDQLPASRDPYVVQNFRQIANSATSLDARISVLETTVVTLATADAFVTHYKYGSR